jgi:non-heme Fe2+,alpha-ketoglutarate-dependent halogenase
MKLFNRKEVIAEVRKILGEDLLLWRTKIFDKMPGEKELGWHQEWGKFNGEEVGNDVPALQHSTDAGEFWNLTVWFAVCDITADMGPIRFARGTHRNRFPIEMAPVMESEFWHESFLEGQDATQLIQRALNNSLVLDYDTSSIFGQVDIGRLNKEEVDRRIKTRLNSFVGAKTLQFVKEEHDVIELPMKAGQFVIFTERTMHGSGPNTSENRRVGINCRIATSDTLVYPGRLRNEYIDGSNLEISKHRCLLLNGVNKCEKNVF